MATYHLHSALIKDIKELMIKEMRIYLHLDQSEGSGLDLWSPSDPKLTHVLHMTFKECISKDLHCQQPLLWGRKNNVLYA